MLRSAAILILLFFTTSFSWSQNSWFHYDWNKENFAKQSALFDQALQQDLRLYKSDGYAGKYYQEFIQERIIYLQEDLDDGKVYGSFEGEERYLREVLKKVIKDSVLANTIKIVFYRDGTLNASMSESGLLRLNVGMLARLNCEAELALMLGHEVGHFVNFDGAKYYKKKKETQNFETQFQFKYGVFGPSIVASQDHWYSRDQEEAADFMSLAYIKESPYSLQAAGNLYRMFKRDEIRAAIKYGPQSTALRSHPDPGERMKVIKNELINYNDQNKKRFVVDSLEFFRLKELCYMETVNIALLENDLDDLITLTFSRYLLEPTHQYNLAVLIEGLRRKIFINNYTEKQDRSFILSQYQSGNKKDLINYNFLLDAHPSILNYLNKGFVDIWKEDMDKILTTDLVNEEKLEFTTNTEAYAYFKNKAKQNKFNVAEHYNYFEPGAKFDDVIFYSKTNVIFLTNDYLTKPSKLDGIKKTVFLMPFNSFEMKDIYNLDSLYFKTKQLNYRFCQGLNSNENACTFQAINTYDLTLEDLHLVQSLVRMSSIELKMEKGSVLTYRLKKNWVTAYPELFRLFSKMNTSELYFCLPYISTQQGFANTKDITLAYYKISVPNNQNVTLVGVQSQLNLKNLKNELRFFKRVGEELNDFIKKQ